MGAIKKFKTHAEAESGKKLHVLRTDRGGEFTSMEFAAYCADQGVRQHHTAPYSPQQNAWWRDETRQWSAWPDP